MKQLIRFFLFICIYSCNFSNNESSSSIEDSNLYSLEETRKIYAQKMPIEWKTEKDAKFLYSMAIHSDSSIGVGFKEASAKHNNFTSNMHVGSDGLLQFGNNLMDMVVEEEGKKREDVIIKEPNRIPSFIFKMSSFSTIKKLVESKEVRYIEILGSSEFNPYHIEMVKQLKKQ